jgi:hypothetical protein
MHIHLNFSLLHRPTLISLFRVPLNERILGSLLHLAVARREKGIASDRHQTAFQNESEAKIGKSVHHKEYH